MTSMMTHDVDAATPEDQPFIDLVHPMPGFPDDRRFALVDLDGSGQLCSMTSLDHEELRFLLAPPATFFPDYSLDLDDLTVDDLGITSSAEVMVLVVVKPGASLLTSTANLRAPVVLNTTNRRACQVIIDDSTLSVSAPLAS